jgi:hypothetical protein
MHCNISRLSIQLFSRTSTYKPIFAKGLGYVGMIFGDEEWEKLVER